ncbi:TonB-dependent receptor domain-containing protein [Halopseudomonas pelagia]|uniref:TonB-dependent receptor n=1 Tax=Halopseudomonas pelagia TaxID=553151 RepID=A0AA91TZV5_9GAMM|nr:TonB-dependent receptor [Halopseudomonas pelagia]PCC98123.1 TonB-dependent receptor [Halopseudomonas pelagia]QFY55064.1 TonB-dependent receptor [Halopseudomonas pelagia]
MPALKTYRQYFFHPTALAMAIAAAPVYGAEPVESDVLNLNEMVVTAAGYEQQLIDAPASITVIGKDQLEGRYYRDVTDALQDIPGVSIEGGAGGKLESTSINIRGLGESYTLFLINGKPLGASTEAYYNGFGSATQVGWLPPLASIERIEVIRGPMSSLYGSSALAGVINIITKTVGDVWSGRLSYDTQFQEDNNAGTARQANFYLSGPLIEDRLGLTLYGSQFERDEDQIEGGYTDKQRVDGTAKLNLVVNQSNSLEFEAGRAEHDNERTEKSGAPGEMNNVRHHYGVTHDLEWGSNLETRTFIISETVDIENGSIESEYSSTLANSKTVLPLQNQTLTLGGEYKWETTAHDASRFYGAANDLELDRWQRAVFVEDEYYLSDDLSVTAGLRFDENEHYGEEFIPRLYAVYRLADSWVVKGGVSGGYKAPTLKQADPGIVENAARSRAFDMGNADLKPESSVNYEVGLMWDAENGISSGATVYYTEFEDQIGKRLFCDTRDGSDPVCEVGGVTREYINQYVNHDSAELRGVELFFNMPLGPVDLKTNYTYSDSEIIESRDSPESIGQPFNNLPRHMFNVGLDWKASAAMGLWAKARYKSKSVEDTESQIPAYTLVDIGGLYRLSDSFDVYAGLYNVWDKEVTAEDYGKTLDGRRLNLGVAFNF